FGPSADREPLQRDRLADLEQRPESTIRLPRRQHRGRCRLPVVEDRAERADRLLRPGTRRRGIKVNALAPGLRATNLNPSSARRRTAAEAAAGAVQLAMLDDNGPTGQLFSWDGTVAPW